MFGIKLKDSRRSARFRRRICAINHGLLTVAAGENVVRVLPPLVIEEAHIAEFVQKISDGAR